MSEPLLTIGAFARAVGLTTSALRHYDECGLLSPAEVDDVTGYRYYTPDLSRRAKLVAQMREVGLSIADMRTVLDAPLVEGRAVLQRFVEEQAAKSARTAATLQEVLSDLTLTARHDRSAELTIRGPELAAAIRQVRAAADSDPNSPLASVLLDVASGSLDVVATNRYWMAIRTIAVDGPADEMRAAISLATARTLAQHLDSREGERLSIGEKSIRVGDRDFDVRAEPYPAHRIVLSGLDEPTTRAVISREALTDAITAMGRAEVVIAIDATGMRLEPSGSVPAHPIDATVSGPGLRVRLGSALTVRAMATALGPEVEWRLSAADRPIRVSSPYQPGFLALVMPLKEA